MAEPRTGVIVMAYGTPERAEDIESYYTDIRRGRPPTAEQLADLVKRYDAIGGLSPLAARTRAQVTAIQIQLDLDRPGRYECWLGQKHASPTIEDAVAAAAVAGVDALVSVVLAPHFSTLSVQQYLDRVEAAAGLVGIDAVVGIPSWHDSSPWIEAQAERVKAALGRLNDDADRVEVMFTAHSLPQRIVEINDPYPAELATSAQAIADRAGIKEFSLAWQSAGRTPEPWIGPDILEAIRSAADRGCRNVVVCPQGFTSDHLEVLYDLDIEAEAQARHLGVNLVRTESLNDDPGLVQAVAGAITATEA